MFNANAIIVDAFLEHLTSGFRMLFPGADPRYADALERAARTALETLTNCDCPYHDVEHTMLVTDCGLGILRGRQLRHGDITPHSWLQGVTAMLFHDIGYIRGLLPDDLDGSYVADSSGRLVALPQGATDASLAPYHVTRGSLFVQDRFAQDPVIDAHMVTACIEMTRFPVPMEAHYQQRDTLPALVRAADLIGQMGDPTYPVKQARLFAEFQETGEARRLDYQTAQDLRDSFPTFFYQQVYPYITEALDYLNLTPDGRQWAASLFHHLHRGSAANPAGAVVPWDGSTPDSHLAEPSAAPARAAGSAKPKPPFAVRNP
jgi:hypothetical protein